MHVLTNVGFGKQQLLHSTALLIVLFVFSGCSALIYEVVWFQILKLAVGSTAFSFAILLASFMSGMFLGSLLFLSWFSVKWNFARRELYSGAATAAIFIAFTQTGGSLPPPGPR